MIPLSKPFIGEEERQGVLEVLDSGYVVQGPKTALFEEQFAQLCQTKHAVAVSNGSVALLVALLAHDIGQGDEVITTPFTFIATATSILMAGAKPVFVDIDETTFNLDPNQIEQAITPKTKAIMPVHLYGQVCNMDAIQTIADKYGLTIVEDAAQAVGATYKGKAAGSFATGAFSLYATKNVMSVEGGMITTNDDAIAEKCRLLRNHGMKRRYYYDMFGFNFRLTDVHAAIGVAQMTRLPAFTAKRQANAAYLNDHIHSVMTPQVHSDCEHVWHQYTVRIPQRRDDALKRLQDAGIGSAIFYPVPAHKHDYMRDIVGDLYFPVTEKVVQEVLSLPVHPQLSPADLEKIVTEVNKL